MDAFIDQAMKVVPAGQALMLLGLVVVIKLLWDQNNHTAEVLTKLTQLETWRDDHEKADDKAFDKNDRDHRDMWGRMNELGK